MKKLIMLAVMSGMVLGQNNYGCMTGYTGIRFEEISQTPITGFNHESLYTAAQNGDLEAVKECLKIDSADFCRNENPKNLKLRIFENYSCDSPSDIAEQFGFNEISQLIRKTEEQRWMNLFHSCIKETKTEYLEVTKKLLGTLNESTWFHNQIPDLISYAVEHNNLEIVNLLNELQKKYVEPTPPTYIYGISCNIPGEHGIDVQKNQKSITTEQDHKN